MRRTLRPITLAASALLALVLTMAAMPVAVAQDFEEIVNALERDGYYIEPGADASQAEMLDLVARGESVDDTWYFVVLAGPADGEYAAALRDAVAPRGNVLVHSVEEEGGDIFDKADLATAYTEAVEDAALVPLDSDWDTPAEYMGDVVAELDGLTNTGGTDSDSDSNSGGGSGFPWWILIVALLVLAGFWFMRRGSRKKKQATDLETAQKIRTEIQTELDELANDVIVLGGPVDLTDKSEAVTYYREATDTYLDISDEIPDVDQLEGASLSELSELGARVSHARWQMDAAEAIIDGEPIPEKPKVAPPPPPATPPAPRSEQRRRMPQREARPRVPYSPSRRRSGGGLLDILIAGAGMMGSRRGGGMFGGGSRGRSRGGGMFGGGSSGRSRGGGMFGGGSRSTPSTRSTPRPGGGVFGSGSRSSRSPRSSSRPRSGRSRSTSRRSSSRSSGGRSTSRRRRR